MDRTLAAGQDYAHPRSLKVGGEPSETASPQNGDQIDADLARFLRMHGQALEWALDHARIEPKDAAGRMGYTDPAVIYRWFSGKERLQLDKLRSALGEKFFGKFLVALMQTCDGVEVETSIRLKAS